MKPRLVTAAASPASLPALSSARQRLADLLDQVAHHERRITEHRAAAERLDVIIGTHRDARAALEAFDAESAAAAAEWAKASLKQNPPTIDGKRRGELLADVAAANENAAAAANAKRQFVESINAESQAITSLKVMIDHAVAEILVEEATGALNDLRAAVADAIAKQARVTAAHAAVVALAHSGGDAGAMKALFDLAADFSETLRNAAAPPAPDSAPAHAAWMKFAVSLRTDAAAQFEG